MARSESKPSSDPLGALERLYINVRAEYPFSVRDMEIVKDAITSKQGAIHSELHEAIRSESALLADMAEAGGSYSSVQADEVRERLMAAADSLFEQLEAQELRQAELLDLARRVSNSFIVIQDRFGIERRKLLWKLRDAVDTAPPPGRAAAPDESGLAMTAGEQLDSDNGVAVESSDHVSEGSHTRETEGVSYPAKSPRA